MPLRMDPARITIAFELPGFRITRNIGIVRGIIVRSHSLLGNIGASLQQSLEETLRFSPSFAKRRAKTLSS